jgi:hypothetical protein
MSDAGASKCRNQIDLEAVSREPKVVERQSYAELMKT